MDTRWKNIVERMYIFVKKNQRNILGIVLVVLGTFTCGIMILYRTSYSSRMVLCGGAAANLFLGSGMTLFLGGYLNRKYRDLNTQPGLDYEEWKRIRTDSYKLLHRGAAVWCFAAAWYLYDLVYDNGVWGGIGNDWHHNYATGYMMVITALIQFLLAQRVVRYFWQEKLDTVMDSREKLLQIRLEEALEVERKSLEKVSRSDQLRVDLITNVSHDLKTPLTSMVGYIELIKKEELSDVVRDYIDVVSARTEKLKEMINSLFALAKAGSGNVEFQKENFEVNRLIEQIFADMEDKVKVSGLQFVMLLTKEDTRIYSDNSYFYRICQNLIENALKYSAEGTRVFVKTYLKDLPSDVEIRSGEHILPDAGMRPVCIEITNTAGYFMDFTKEDIVERFARADKARTSEGNGLGLAIVSTYAKALGGEFDIRIDCDQFKACLEMRSLD